MEANDLQGHFKARIGRSVNTLYGQVFVIDVKRVELNLSKLEMRCETLHQLLDYGRNDAVIGKFLEELQHVLKLQAS